MGIIEKLWCVMWNIGFVEKSIEQLATDGEEVVEVKWLKHGYNDRFFADPFMLSGDERVIRVLVEEYFYHTKRGVISLLEVDAKNYELRRRKVVLECSWHQSFPFIQRIGDKVYVVPEAANSGKAIAYEWDDREEVLVNPFTIVDDCLLDGTYYHSHDGWYLTATKAGEEKHSLMYLYRAKEFCGPYVPLFGGEPIVKDADAARSAGYIVEVDGELYRMVQVCSKVYGEYVKVFRIKKMDADGFEQEYVKDLRPAPATFGATFHTVNGLGSVTVVDGTSRRFRPYFKIKSALRYALNHK